MPTDPRARAADMRKLVLAGRTLDEIGELYGVSGARVSQILQQRGAGSRGRRQPPGPDLPDAVQSFLDTYRDAIVAMAGSGVSRAEVVERFRLFAPEVDTAVIGAGITAAGALFDADARTVSFTPAAITGAVLYVLAVSLDLPCDRTAAIREADLQQARAVAAALTAQGTAADAVAQVLCRAASARAYARGNPTGPSWTGWAG